jgi:hypothetical protein
VADLQAFCAHRRCLDTPSRLAIITRLPYGCAVSIATYDQESPKKLGACRDLLQAVGASGRWSGAFFMESARAVRSLKTQQRNAFENFASFRACGATSRISRASAFGMGNS